MRSVFALSIAATATLGAAQLPEQYTIDPNSVPEATRGKHSHLSPITDTT